MSLSCETSSRSTTEMIRYTTRGRSDNIEKLHLCPQTLQACASYRSIIKCMNRQTYVGISTKDTVRTYLVDTFKNSFYDNCAIIVMIVIWTRKTQKIIDDCTLDKHYYFLIYIYVPHHLVVRPFVHLSVYQMVNAGFVWYFQNVFFNLSIKLLTNFRCYFIGVLNDLFSQLV